MCGGVMCLGGGSDVCGRELKGGRREAKRRCMIEGSDVCVGGGGVMCVGGNSRGGGGEGGRERGGDGGRRE